MNKFSKYVGLDTHADTIAVAVSDAIGGKPRYYGEIPNRLATANSRIWVMRVMCWRHR